MFFRVRDLTADTFAQLRLAEISLPPPPKMWHTVISRHEVINVWVTVTYTLSSQLRLFSVHFGEIPIFRIFITSMPTYRCYPPGSRAKGATSKYRGVCFRIICFNMKQRNALHCDTDSWPDLVRQAKRYGHRESKHWCLRHTVPMDN